MLKIRFTQEQFLENCKKAHGNRYDYSKAEYKTCFDLVTIICKEHGEFEQLPLKHCNLKQGCPKCSGNVRLENEEVIKRFIDIHGDKYDYSRVRYGKNNHIKVEIICKKHGSFFQTPKNHLKGFGCSICSGNKKLTTEEFIRRSINVHGNIFTYEKTEYVEAYKKVIITCKIHGDFSQNPHAHITSKCGCPVCKASKGERKIAEFLCNKNIIFKKNKTFNECRSQKGYLLKFDFYLPNYNTCIEYDGEQHYVPKNYFGGESGFKMQRERDKAKNNFCKKFKIKLIRIKYNQNIEKKLNKFLLQI